MSPSDRTMAELLSAYHDGEVTAAERAEVERLLRESPEARAELAEISQLGNLFGESSVESLPSEFRGRVLQAVERSMLLPAQEELSTPPARRRSGMVWAGMGGLLATTAAIVFAVVLLDDPAARMELASDATVDTPDDSPLGDDSQPIASYTAPMKRHGFFKDEKSANDSVADAEEKLGREPLDDGVAETPQAEAASAPAVDFLQGEIDKETNRERLEKATVGSVIETLDTSGSRIAVVRLTVVDRQMGLDAVRLLLARHRIPLQNVSAPDGRTAHPGFRTADEMEMVEAVFVRADRNRLAAVLDELRNSTGVRGMAVEEPVAIADLDTASQRRARRELGEATASGQAGGSLSGDSASRMSVRDEHRIPSAPAASSSEKAAVADEKAGPKKAPVPASEASDGTVADEDAEQIGARRKSANVGKANRIELQGRPATARQLSPQFSRELLRTQRSNERALLRFGSKPAARSRRSGTGTFENDSPDADASEALKVEDVAADIGRGAGAAMEGLAKPSELRVLLVLVKEEGVPQAQVPPVPPQPSPALDADIQPRR